MIAESGQVKAAGGTPATATEGQTAIKPFTLRRNFALTTFGNIIYAASSWLMLAVIAKLGNPQMVGQFALGLAVTQPVIFLTQLNLSSVLSTDVAREHSFGDYFGLRTITNLLAIVITAIACVAGGYSIQSDWIVVITGIGAAVDSISDLIYGEFRRHERMERIAVSLAFKGPLSLIGVAAGIVLAHSVLWAATGSALASVVVVLFYDQPGCARLLSIDNGPAAVVALGPLSVPRMRFETSILRSLAYRSAPMGLVMMLAAFSANLPRYFVEHYHGEQQLGIFSAIASFVAVGRVIVMALGTSATPRLAVLARAGDADGFVRLSMKLVALGVAIGTVTPLIAVFAGRCVLTMLYKPEYAQHTNLLVIMLIGGGLSYIGSFLGFAITAAQWFKIQVPMLSSVTAAGLLAAWLLVPHYNLIGAGVAFIISMLVNVLFGIVVLSRIVASIKSGVPVAAR